MLLIYPRRREALVDGLSQPLEVVVDGRLERALGVIQRHSDDAGDRDHEEQDERDAQPGGQPVRRLQFHLSTKPIPRTVCINLRRPPDSSFWRRFVAWASSRLSSTVSLAGQRMLTSISRVNTRLGFRAITSRSVNSFGVS